jgi:hypothetical protein
MDKVRNPSNSKLKFLKTCKPFVRLYFAYARHQRSVHIFIVLKQSHSPVSYRSLFTASNTRTSLHHNFNTISLSICPSTHIMFRNMTSQHHLLTFVLFISATSFVICTGPLLENQHKHFLSVLNCTNRGPYCYNIVKNYVPDTALRKSIKKFLFVQNIFFVTA